jgi:succinate dehydrogenase/fumarate reductase flavoprotein subunit
MMMDIQKGKGPIYMRTEEAISKISKAMPDEKAARKKLKELESEAWEDFLDMTIAQALLWASTNVEPEKKPSEIMACEPYFIGSHSGASGAWVSGPKDLQTERDRERLLLGLRQHDHGSGHVRRRRCQRCLQPQVLVGIVHRRPAWPARPPWPSLSTTPTRPQ